MVGKAFNERVLSLNQNETPMDDGHAKRRQEAEANASKLRWEIDGLAAGHKDVFTRRYKEFWQHARKISALFKELKPLHPTDRERLWSRFSQLCEEAKGEQKEAVDNKRHKSAQRKADILFHIRAAEMPSGNFVMSIGPPNIAEMKSRGRALKKATNLLSEYKHEMMGTDKQECFERIKTTRESHDFWWQELRKRRDRKHEEFRARVRANLERNRERQRRTADALQRHEERARDLRAKIASAWNPDWAAKASGWLSELEAKIRDIEQHLSRIESWILEDEEKLR